MPTGGGGGRRLNIMMPSYQYRDLHVKDKTVVRPIHRKTVFILRRGPNGLAPSGTRITEQRWLGLVSYVILDWFKTLRPSDA